MSKMYASKALLLSLTAAFLWACQIVIFRYQITTGENAYTLALWSTAIELPIWLTMLYKKKSEVLKLTPRILGIVALIGFGSAIAIGLMENLALAHTTATNFAFLIRTVVFFTIIFSAFFFKEPITKKKLIMTVTILSGAYFLNIQNGHFMLKLGDIFTLIEAASIAFFTNILVKKLVTKLDPDFTAGAVFIAGTLFLSVVLIIQKAPLQLHNVFLLALYSLCNIGFARIRNRAFQVASATYITMILSLTPVFTLLLSFALLGEKLISIQLFGGFLIILTSFLAEILKI
jgi:drug/metabolite transporter (DMT)-like permease